jgi:hypothetical protein
MGAWPCSDGALRKGGEGLIDEPLHAGEDFVLVEHRLLKKKI